MARPSKGVQISLRFHPEHKRVFEETAAKLGYRTLGDYVAAVMAETHDLEPQWSQRPVAGYGAEQLPLEQLPLAS